MIKKNDYQIGDRVYCKIFNNWLVGSTTFEKSKSKLIGTFTIIGKRGNPWFTEYFLLTEGEVRGKLITEDDVKLMNINSQHLNKRGWYVRAHALGELVPPTIKRDRCKPCSRYLEQIGRHLDETS